MEKVNIGQNGDMISSIKCLMYSSARLKHGEPHLRSEIYSFIRAHFLDENHAIFSRSGYTELTIRLPSTTIVLYTKSSDLGET